MIISMNNKCIDKRIEKNYYDKENINCILSPPWETLVGKKKYVLIRVLMTTLKYTLSEAFCTSLQG